MCHEWWSRRERRREERFDEELRYLLDEQPRHGSQAMPIVEHEESLEPERPEVEAGTR